MKRNFLTVHWNTILSSILRLILVFFVIAVVTGMKVPFVSGEKANFIALIHIGVAVSIASNWRLARDLRLTDSINISGSILGVAATLLIIFTVKDINIPLITGYKSAFLALAVLLFLKVGLKILFNTRAKVEASK